MQLFSAISQIYPGIRFPEDCLLVDHCDGNGPFIAAWNYSQPQPTPEQLAPHLAQPEPVERPRKASRAQVLLALHAAGLYDAFQTYIASAPIPVQIAASEQTWSLDSPNIAVGMAAMGITDAQAADLMSAASQIVV